MDYTSSTSRFGLGISVFDSKETVRLGSLAERLGYDSIWIADHLIDLEACKIDPWVVMGGIGVQTSRITMGTAVTDAQRVHPSKLTQILATLDEMTDGRAVIGLGAGEVMNTTPFGLPWEEPPERIARLVEAVQVIRLLWKSNRERPVSFEGKYFGIDNGWLDQKHSNSSSARIYLGALHSTALLQTTGAIADGWLDFLSIPELCTKKIAKIKQGAERAGRRINDIDTTAWLGVVFTSDKKELESGINGIKVLLASERSSLKRLGFEIPVPEEKKYVNCIPTKSVIEEAVKASKEIPDEIAEKFLIHGDDVSDALNRLDQFVKAGITHFQFCMLTWKTDEMMRRFSEKVLGEFRSKRN